MLNKFKVNWASKNGLLIVISSVVLAGLFSVISYLYFDKNLLNWQVHNHQIYENIFLLKVIALLGKVWVPVWLLFVRSFFTGRRRDIMAVLFALVLLSMVVPALKESFDRPRPRDIIEHNIQTGDLDFSKCSFPSGDTASIFAIGTACLPYIGLLQTGAIFILAVIVGVLRVVSLAHFPSDVFAGAAIGILAGFAGYLISEKIAYFRNDLIKILNPTVIVITIIIIPVMEFLFGKRNEFILFLKFYLPAVIILVLIFSILKRKNKFQF